MILDLPRPSAGRIRTCRFEEVCQVVAGIPLRKMKQARLGHHRVVGVFHIRRLIGAGVVEAIRSRFLLAKRGVKIVVELDFDRVFSQDCRAGFTRIVALLRRRSVAHNGVGVEWARTEGGHAHAGSAREHVGRLRGAGESCYLEVPS
jgi:hypothetical protein